MLKSFQFVIHKFCVYRRCTDLTQEIEKASLYERRQLNRLLGCDAAWLATPAGVDTEVSDGKKLHEV